jgi:hypothetical protein
MTRKKRNLPLHMSGTPERFWWDGKKNIPVKKLSNAHLKRAKMFAQKKELEYFKLVNVFNGLVEMLEIEAERRGIELKDFDSAYHKKRRNQLNKKSDER